MSNADHNNPTQKLLHKWWWSLLLLLLLSLVLLFCYLLYCSWNFLRGPSCPPCKLSTSTLTAFSRAFNNLQGFTFRFLLLLVPPWHHFPVPHVLVLSWIKRIANICTGDAGAYTMSLGPWDTVGMVLFLPLSHPSLLAANFPSLP